MRFLLLIVLVMIILGLVAGIYLNRSYGNFYNFQKEQNLQAPTRDDIMLIGSGNRLPHKVAFMGDSLTAGVGAGSYEESYPYLVASNESASKNPVLLINYAKPGVNSSQVLADQLALVEAQKPDRVYVLMGINDVHNLKSVDEFEINYNQLISQLKDKTEAEIILLTIPFLGSSQILHYPLNNLLDFRTKQFNGIIRKLAKTYDIKVIDLYGWSKDQFELDNNLYSSDQFHPSNQGYNFWAKIINAN